MTILQEAIEQANRWYALWLEQRKALQKIADGAKDARAIARAELEKGE